MEGGRDIQRDGAGTQFLGLFDGTVDGGLVAGDDDVAGVVVIGDDADTNLGARGGGGLGQRQVGPGPDQRGHGTHADGHGALHGLTAQLQQSRRGAEREIAGGTQGRILAERMAGHEGGAGHIDAELDLQDADSGQRHRHQGGLGILGQGKLVLGPLAHQHRQLLAERLIDLGIDLACRGKGVGERHPHADRLAALSGEQQGEGHVGAPAVLNRAGGVGRSGEWGKPGRPPKGGRSRFITTNTTDSQRTRRV